MVLPIIEYRLKSIYITLMRGDISNYKYMQP